MRKFVQEPSVSAVAPLNPQLHDEFVALGALYYSGEISEEEWALLQIHMAYCDSCHERFLGYQQIASNVIPAMAGMAASELDNSLRESTSMLQAAERKLMSRLDFVTPDRELARERRPNWRFRGAMIAACSLILIGVAGVDIVRMRSRTDKSASSRPTVPRAIQYPGTTPAPDLQRALKRSQERITSLEQQAIASDDRLRIANLAMAGIAKQLEAAQHAQEQLSATVDTLSLQLASFQSEVDSPNNKWVAAKGEAVEHAARVAALETQVNELQATLDEKDSALSEKDRMLALDKDFLEHDRDIRDLVGARNLYIADIFDTNESGKTARQFGRIFYTRDRSLVFYGFDLDSQVGHRQNVSFQVWGSRSDRPTPVSLGLFYQDDGHKRWVLRCSDAKTLARLDTVFVTVEPPGGSGTPTGKQLLRASLQINPNHP